MSDCCNSKGTSSEDSSPNPICPECGEKGQKIDTVTPKTLLTLSARAKFEPGQYYFCSSQNCLVVYFNDVRSAVFHKSNIEVPVWNKDGHQDPSILVCYCFDHSEKSIREEITRTGKTEVQASVKAHVKAGRCACEMKNPQGTCCLGNIHQVIVRIRDEE